MIIKSKVFLGYALIILGICFGIYITFWECLIKSIVFLIDAIRGSPFTSLDITINIIKLLFASFFGVILGGIPTILGVILTEENLW